MKLHRILAFTAASLLASAPAFAGLIGATVTGTLSFGGFGATNYFDSNNGFVPAGYLNSSPNTPTVVISGSAPEFAFGPNPLMVANFSDTQLLVSTTSPSTGNYNSWTMTFSSSAFSAQSLSLVTQSYTPGLTSSLVGDLITINWAGSNLSGPVSMQATYNIGPASVPEGGATVLMLAGALLTLAAGQRRLKLAR